MKGLILFFSFMIMINTVHSQENIILNSSFEDTVVCPSYLHQSHYAFGWNININTADYYHSCNKDTQYVSVPKNVLGYQCPANGDAYSGINAYVYFNAEANEFIGCKLSVPLLIGQKYFVTFKVNLAQHDFIKCGVDKLGALFTNASYDTTVAIIFNPNPLIANKAHIYTENIITDTINWQVVRGSFIADSAYQYILIGHFFDYYNTIFECQDTNYKQSYYYLDDVCVSTDSLICEIPNGPNVCDSAAIISNLLYENINLYPNPTSEKILIEFPYYQKINIKIYNLFGILFFERNFWKKNVEIDLSLFPDGTYLIQAQQDNKIFNKKITLIK